MLYKEGAEVRFLKFNATGMDRIKWFSQKQLINSSWTDLKTYQASKWRFNIFGARKVKRSFEISTPYNGCGNDGGWLVMTSTISEPDCDWPKRNNVSSIVYSANRNSTNFNRGKIKHFLCLKSKLTSA